MNWTALTAHYGFQRPFTFHVVIRFLLSFLGFIVVLVTCAYLFSTGALNIGTERFYFFSYLLVLLLCAAIFSRYRPISVVAFLWFVVEAGLGLSNSDLLPQNYFKLPRDHRFVYDPLLLRMPRPGWQQTIRYDGRNKDLISWATLMTQETWDQDFSFVHNSLGLRGAELTANDLAKPLIFAYGGSTTYDYMVSQGETWVEQLQLELNRKFTVVNFGAPGHSTVQHVIRTALYQDILGKRPVCAIYYVGGLDLGMAYGEKETPADAALSLAVRSPDIWVSAYSPLLRLISRKVRRRFDSIPHTPSLSGERPLARTDAHPERLLAERIRTIVAINNSRGIKTVLIGELLNRDLLGKSNPEHDGTRVWFGLIRSTDAWPLQERLSLIMEHAGTSHGASYIDAGVENFRINDFADVGHFSAAGSRKFATLISKKVGNVCQ